MALSDRDMQLIEEGTKLATLAILAAVKARKDDGPIDWNAVRITMTPEQALAEAQERAGRK